MSPEADRGLAGRRILLTRPAGRAAALAGRLERLGAVVELRPTIRLVAPRDAGPARRALLALEHHSWILFTSAAGVSFFFDMLREVGGEAVSARIAAIGPATARAVEGRGLSPSHVAQHPTSEGLAGELTKRIAPGERVLLVRPEVAREVLPESLRRAGVEVDAVAFYRNEADPGVTETVARLIAGRYDAVVFSSPSTFGRLLEGAADRAEELRRALSSIRRVAIGEVTAAALREAALPPSAVALQPTDSGIADALRVCFADDG